MIHDFFKCEHGVRMTGDARREQILQAAISLFSQKGFRGTTTKEIGKAAGVQILQGSGVNAASRIRIRGNTSISLSNDPIVFVDGIRPPPAKKPGSV